MAQIFNSFRLITREDDQHDKHLTLALELPKGVTVPSEDEIVRLKEIVFEAVTTTTVETLEDELA